MQSFEEALMVRVHWQTQLSKLSSVLHIGNHEVCMPQTSVCACQTRHHNRNRCQILSRMAVGETKPVCKVFWVIICWRFMDIPDSRWC